MDILPAGTLQTQTPATHTAAARPAVSEPESGEKQHAPSADTNRLETQALRQLRNRDRAVRAHEQAHLVAAGRYATSGANFNFQRGPDGILYAVGGDVQIDISPVPGDPRATVQKAETIRRAALAPSDPSSQDRQVAAQASRMAAQARAEIIQATRESPTAADSVPEDSEDTGAARLERRLINSGAVSLKTETIEQLDLLI